MGGSLSFQLEPKLPGAICSNPRAKVHSARPPRTVLLAWYKAVDPVEQLLFTFVIGMPVRPRLYRARCRIFN